MGGSGPSSVTNISPAAPKFADKPCSFIRAPEVKSELAIWSEIRMGNILDNEHWGRRPSTDYAGDFQTSGEPNVQPELVQHLVMLMQCFDGSDDNQVRGPNWVAMRAPRDSQERPEGDRVPAPSVHWSTVEATAMSAMGGKRTLRDRRHMIGVQRSKGLSEANAHTWARTIISVFSPIRLAVSASLGSNLAPSSSRARSVAASTARAPHLRLNWTAWL